MGDRRAGHRRRGRVRHRAVADGKTFPNGPGLYYSNPYFLGGEDYKGPYTDPGGYDAQQAVTVDGNDITVKMAKPFPDFPYYASMPAIGPIPTDPAVSDPAKYAQHPLATGPYKIEQYTIGKSLTLVRNDQWDPATDPSRTAYPDKYVFKAGLQAEQIDQILLADSGEAKTTISYDDVLAQDYRKFNDTGRLVTGGQPCTYFYALDQRKVPDKSIAEALTWALPYNDQIVATGLIPEVNAVATQNLMPPGVPGREEYDPVEGHGPFQTDADKAKQILADSGNEGYELKFLYSTDSDVSVAGKDVLVKGLEAAGFKATPVATTLADSSPTVTTSTATSTCVPTAGAPTGRRVRPGCRRSSSRPTSRRWASAPTSPPSTTPRSTRRSTPSSNCPPRSSRRPGTTSSRRS